MSSMYINFEGMVTELTKCDGRLSNEVSLMLNYWHQTKWVDFGEKPVWLLLQVNVDLLIGDFFSSHNQSHALYEVVWMEGLKKQTYMQTEGLKCTCREGREGR